ncbi:unnamed protein product [Polarella glacialis]|uniref:Methyltransferase-like protein n=2 Tax=Polarella glacialis TaxID=89957 RepID=A0A813GQA7_POLGL|nr:unnamed protein product [Polarella glacialis]CAE8624796.1 unnamed protein product [Polarella glacialis]
MASTEAATEEAAPAAAAEEAPLVAAAATSRAPPKGPQKRRPPRTHLHAELVKKRKDPLPSPKVEVEAALRALQVGDQAAVEALMARSGEEPVAEEWQQRYKTGARGYWDQFYKEKNINFFKDRNYLREEFPELMPSEVVADPKRWVDALETSSQGPPCSRPELLKAMEGRTVLLELGCAVGNGLIPMLRANPELFGLGCDLSAEAVQLLRSKEEYSCGRCLAFPCDITKSRDQPTPEHSALEDQVPEGSVDFATLLFVLSAIDPSEYPSTIARIRERMRPGGVVMVRDYGRGDLAQLRFGAGHWMGGDSYVRGDGTLAVFLTDTGLASVFEASGFETLSCEYRRTEVTNRGTGVVMPRVWVQGRFRRQL